MYPHPELNSFLQGINAHVPRKVLNKAVEKATFEEPICDEYRPHIMRLVTTQPQCYAPHVDVTRAKCAYGRWALPKLKKELHSDDPLIVRQAVTTLGDILVYPEKTFEAVELKIVDRLYDLLISEDPYLRERVAMIYVTIANQAAGRRAIVKNLFHIVGLAKGLDDNLAAVRLKIAQALEFLASDYCTADELCACGFMESITAKLCSEKKNVLLVLLKALKFLLHRDVKTKAVNNGTFDNLMTLLERNDEEVLSNVLVCLGIVCEDIRGKQKAVQVDLLRSLIKFMKDERVKVNIEAVRVASFITITTEGKLRALELKIPDILMDLITNKCCRSCELLLAIIKLLTNIAEAPEGRRLLKCKYMTCIEDLDVEVDEVLCRHKHTLIDVIRWKP